MLLDYFIRFNKNKILVLEGLGHKIIRLVGSNSMTEIWDRINMNLETA